MGRKQTTLLILLILAVLGIWYSLSHKKSSPVSTSSILNTPLISTIIKIPLLVDQGDPAYLNQGKLVGCDRVVMTERPITPAQVPLSAALQELFKRADPWPPIGKPGNFITSQTKLSFDKVTIDKGVASIYLNGSYILAGVCDDPRLKTVLEETTLQFGAVTSVKFFLNGQPATFVFSEK